MKPLANSLVTVALCAVTSISPVYALQPQTPVEIVRGQTEFEWQRFQSMVNNYNIEPFVTPAREAALQAARQAKQIMQANAYSRYITEGRGLDRTIEQRMKFLQDALDAGDLSGARHEFTVIQYAEQRKSELIQDWIRATPSDLYVGESEVTLTDVTQQPPPPEPPAPPGPEQTGNAASATKITQSGAFGLGATTAVVGTIVVIAGVSYLITKDDDSTTNATQNNN